MTILEIDAMDVMIDQLIAEGVHNSAFRLLSDTVWKLVRRPFALHPDTKLLVHYTSIDVLFSMLSCPLQHDARFTLSSSAPSEELDRDSGFLRMYDTFNSNDPNEGLFFVQSTPRSHPFVLQHSNLWKLLEDRAKLPAYVASFRGVSEVEEVDDLVFWRTYAKEGEGCAIVCPVSFFGPDTPVLQVKYGDESVKSSLDHLSTIFSALSSARSLRQHNLLYTTNAVPKYVSSSLSPIPYVHKAKDYEFEAEVRVVVPFVDLIPRSLFCHRIHDRETGVKLRHFAHLPALKVLNLLRTDSLIMLGPAVQSKTNLSFVLQRRLINIGLVGTKICTSKIDYRS